MNINTLTISKVEIGRETTVLGVRDAKIKQSLTNSFR